MKKQKSKKELLTILSNAFTENFEMYKDERTQYFVEVMKQAMIKEIAEKHETIRYNTHLNEDNFIALDILNNSCKDICSIYPDIIKYINKKIKKAKLEKSKIVKLQKSKQEVIKMIDDYITNVDFVIPIYDYEDDVSTDILDKMKNTINALRPTMLDELNEKVEAYEHNSDLKDGRLLAAIVYNAYNDITSKYYNLAVSICEEIYQESLL